MEMSPLASRRPGDCATELSVCTSAGSTGCCIDTFGFTVNVFYFSHPFAFCGLSIDTQAESIGRPKKGDEHRFTH